MAKWITLRARFPDDEFEEIERIKEKYDLSFNEIIRSGVKFYVGLTVAKELLANTSYGKEIKIRGKTLNEILNSPKYQSNLEQKIIKLVKLGLFEFFEIGMEFKEKTRSIRKTRHVGRPKRKKSVGRPKQ
ncbi:MAG: hypothetical protein NPMRTH1_710001 [Nitrosopumilales archaeon]|nr:MAG: hypothetical protein NPMRTH1_710001 [Nitrosopumilales archaeon]